MDHTFIFNPGKWKGEGLINFSGADDQLAFTMTFEIENLKNERIKFNQIVHIEGFDDVMENHFEISKISAKDFSITLNNHLISNVAGEGLINQKILAWEFHKPDECEGFEIYEKLDNGDYLMRAEYMGGDEFRTYIKGTLKKL
jgi:hypothetical protein